MRRFGHVESHRPRLAEAGQLVHAGLRLRLRAAGARLLGPRPGGRDRRARGRAAGVHLRLPGHGTTGPTLEIYQYGSMPDGLPPAMNRPASSTSRSWSPRSRWRVNRSSPRRRVYRRGRDAPDGRRPVRHLGLRDRSGGQRHRAPVLVGHPPVSQRKTMPPAAGRRPARRAGSTCLDLSGRRSKGPRSRCDRSPVPRVSATRSKQ